MGLFNYKRLYAFATICLMICAYLLFAMGYDWITIGYGLNPYIAFPLCGIALCFAAGCLICAIDEHHQQLTDEDWDRFHYEAKCERERKLAAINSLRK